MGHAPVQNVSRTSSGIGWALGILASALLLMSAVMKFVRPPGFEEGLVHMGWDEVRIFYVGIVEAACAAIYLFPRTAILGAILLTGYLGGAVATHVRVGDLFVVPLGVGIVIWLGLYLREPRLRSLVPFRS